MKILAPIKQIDKEGILATIVRFASHTKSEIYFLHVVDITPLERSFLSQPPRSFEDYLTKKGEKLIEHAESLAKKKKVRAGSKVAKGEPSEEILEEAAGYDLLAMRPRVFSQKERLGNVAKKVLSRINKPIVLVNAEKRSFKICLVPVDGSEESLKALYEIKERGYNLKKLFILYIHGEEEESDEEKYEDKVIIDSAKNVVRDTSAEVKAEVVHLEQGDMAREILKYGNKVGADMIFMGTRGRSELSRLILGSVSKRVVCLSRVPVVLFPPHYVPR